MAITVVAETRTTTVIRDVAWLRERHDWPGLNGVIVVESIRETADKIEQETRFYITSLVLLAHLVGPIIRSHWAIDVTHAFGKSVRCRFAELRALTRPA